jgi:hypothetical protein
VDTSRRLRFRWFGGWRAPAWPLILNGREAAEVAVPDVMLDRVLWQLAKTFVQSNAA